MYVGLVGPDGAEIRKRGYRRVCIADVKWAMLPGETAGMWFVFVNLDEVRFPVALESWGEVKPALFKEPNASSPMQILEQERPGRFVIGARQHAAIHPGKLKFDSTPF
jgi:hypothetical protein